MLRLMPLFAVTAPKRLVIARISMMLVIFVYRRGDRATGRRGEKSPVELRMGAIGIAKSSGYCFPVSPSPCRPVASFRHRVCHFDLTCEDVAFGLFDLVNHLLRDQMLIVFVQRIPDPIVLQSINVHTALKLPFNLVFDDAVD